MTDKLFLPTGKAQMLATLQIFTALLSKSKTRLQIAKNTVKMCVSIHRQKQAAFWVLDENNATLFAQKGYPSKILQSLQEYFETSYTFKITLAQKILYQQVQFEKYFLKLAIIQIKKSHKVIIAYTLDENIKENPTLLQECSMQVYYAYNRIYIYEQEQKLRKEAQQAIIRAHGLQKVTSLLAQATTTKEVAQIIFNEGFHVLKASNGEILFIDDDNFNFIILAHAGYPESYQKHWPKMDRSSPMLINDTLNSQKSYYLLDTKDINSKYKIAKNFIKESKVSSIAYLPLKVNNKVFGLMEFNFLEKQTFPKQDRVFMETLANQCAQAFERVIAQEEVQKSEQKYRFLAESMPQIVFTILPNGNFDYMNQYLQTYTGLAYDFSSADYWQKVVHQKDITVISTGWLQALKTAQTYHTEVRLKSHDGIYRWFLVQIVPMHNAQQQIVKWFGTAIDINNMKKAMERLEVLSLVSGNINSELDTKTIMQKLTKAALALTNATMGTYGLIEGNKMIFPQYYQANKFFPLNVSFAKGQGTPGHMMQTKTYYMTNDTIKDPYVMQDLQKKYHYYNLINIPIFNRNHQLIGCLSVYNKIDHQPFTENNARLLQSLAESASIALENAQMLAERKASEQRKDDFISMASHELKTPVTSAKVFMHVLKKRLIENKDEEIEKILQKTDNQLDKLTELIKQLLDVTRLQEGKMLLNKEPFFLKDLITEVVESMQPIVTHKIIVDLQVQIPILADKERLRQVIINFITNAVKYSSSQKPIRLSSSREKNYIIAAVSDSGKGIPKEEQEKIFERFYQGVNDNGTYPGLGLGLYISSEIIKMHQGKIWVESKEGKGSTFYFSLPIFDKQIKDAFK